MANEEREVDLVQVLNPHTAQVSEGYPPQEVDSQLVITLFEGEREPHLQCTKAGRMTGQMVMGLEGAGIMKIDNVLRAAQLAMRRKAGQIPPPNTKTIEDRLMQTKENSGG